MVLSFAQSEHDGARLLAQRHGSWCHFVGAEIVRNWGKSACVRAECAADWQQENRTSTKTENGVAWDHPLGGVLAHPSPHNRPDPVTLPQNFSYLHNFSCRILHLVCPHATLAAVLLFLVCVVFVILPTSFNDEFSPTLAVLCLLLRHCGFSVAWRRGLRWQPLYVHMHMCDVDMFPWYFPSALGGF